MGKRIWKPDVTKDRNWLNGATERLLASGVAGKATHDEVKNLKAIRRLSEGDPFYTFGIEDVDGFTPEQIAECLSRLKSSSEDTNLHYLSPRMALEGLILGANLLKKTVEGGGKIFLGTGHPGGLLSFYQELAKLIGEMGGKVITPALGMSVSDGRLDYLGGVAVITDGCSIFHTHDTEPMELIIKLGEEIDLALVDHGFAGAAINHGIPVIAVMDTNDPALAVAKKLGAKVILIPISDNALSSSYRAVMEIMREIMGIA